MLIELLARKPLPIVTLAPTSILAPSPLSLQPVSERRVRKWAFSCWDMLRDPVGRDHFKHFLEKEYATENLLFVEAVWGMKKMAQRDVADECRKIWTTYLGAGEECSPLADPTPSIRAKYALSG